MQADTWRVEGVSGAVMGESGNQTVRATRTKLLSAGGSVIFVVAATVVNGSNFLFHVAVGRQLGPSDYGALGAVLGILLVLVVPDGARVASPASTKP